MKFTTTSPLHLAFLLTLVSVSDAFFFGRSPFDDTGRDDDSNNECDLTGMYEFISISPSLNFDNGGDLAQTSDLNQPFYTQNGAPATNVGRFSLDCYKVPDALFNLQFGDEEVADFGESFFAHPNMATGAKFFDACLDGVKDLFGITNEFLSGSMPLYMGQDSLLDIEIPFQEEIGSFCATELQGGVDFMKPLFDAGIGYGFSGSFPLYGNTNPTYLGSSLTFRGEDLSKVYDLYDVVQYNDFCHEIADYVHSNLSDDTCFFAGSVGEIGVSDNIEYFSIPLVEGEDVCFPYCGYQMKSGLLYVWMNGRAGGGVDSNPFERNLHPEGFVIPPTTEDIQLHQDLVGYVMHKVSNN